MHISHGGKIMHQVMSKVGIVIHLLFPHLENARGMHQCRTGNAARLYENISTYGVFEEYAAFHIHGLHPQELHMLYCLLYRHLSSNHCCVRSMHFCNILQQGVNRLTVPTSHRLWSFSSLPIPLFPPRFRGDTIFSDHECDGAAVSNRGKMRYVR